MEQSFPNSEEKLFATKNSIPIKSKTKMKDKVKAFSGKGGMRLGGQI